jgi:uncharacterized protein (DUF305 family)
MNRLLLIILILFIIVIFFKINKENFIQEPCSDNLSDREYLLHMIPHHQVAVDISIMLQKITKDPIMQDLLRKLIWTQKYEIGLMKELLDKLPYNYKGSIKYNYISTRSDFVYPNKLGLTKTYCDPHFFDPEEHMKHLHHMKINDKMYIEHMIPHHQVAVDMSKKLLKNTKNTFMIHLAYRIIRSQQHEIILLNDLLNKDNFKFNSKLV